MSPARRSVGAGAASLEARLRPGVVPPPAAQRAKHIRELMAAAREQRSLPELAPLVERAETAAFVGSVMESSPFLRALILDDPARLVRLLDADPDDGLASIVALVGTSWRAVAEVEFMASLRAARAETALLVALADLGSVWSVDEVMAAMTAFADAAVGAVASFVLSQESESGTLVLPDPEEPQRGSGWIILAMGKHGAGELNYSSDIDLISLFDADAADLAPDTEPAKLYVRMTRKFIHILQERTPEGYVFRTDLRLRPDPGSTAIAIPTIAAYLYYESQGQNWERAALIKARPVAGDVAAGEAFLHGLTPYLWRKYLDYAAIADIHSIKRQIHDFRGHETIAIAGHNLKLGRGGIREIEFFVQTQQLIAGGRNPVLRQRRTLDMLDALTKAGWIEDATAADLAAAYRLLRRIEHRLQMVADEQTHSLPEDDDDLQRIARFSGYRGRPEFEKALRPQLEMVQRHYAQLFETAPSLGSGTGSLVFTGEDDDPDTVATLSRLGYADPGAVIRTIRGWHFGRYAAMRSATARERLTEVTPALLEALGRGDNPDAAFLAFDRFLSRMPAGLQLFALVSSNPSLLGLLVRILGTAPRLAEIITRRPHVLDAVIEPAFFGSVPTTEALEPLLRQTIDQASSYEDALDRARIFGQEQAFLIGVRVIAGTIDARQAGRAYSALADLMVGEALRLSERSLAEAHGPMPGGEVALIAMGKFGGREMTAASDLDLILLYSVPASTTGSTGTRALSPTQYYTRLTQRLVAALSAPTAEGRLYEVDFRLRPSGNAGPLALSIDAFAAYQIKEAWTWEHLALTRARPVAGSPKLVAKAAKEIAAILRLPRDPKKLVAEILDMRALLAQEKGGRGIWDIKQAPGGLIDIEFAAQFLQLRFGHDHPDIHHVETEQALRAALDAGVLSPGRADILLPALRLYQDVTQILRLCIDETFRPEEASRSLKELLGRAADMPDFGRLEGHLVATEDEVRAVFEELIGKVPAKPRQG
ncbi:MAG: bifunctional [glutamine synthetase] adenylyltransferase/[glutamine synthetase]-adenylyl-L-tyrosine phosphorylase [Bauldia sp.]